MRPNRAELAKALLVALAFAAMTWMAALLFVAMSAGVAIGLVISAVAGKDARTPWWMDAGPVLAGAVLVYSVQFGLTSWAIRQIGRPARPVFGYVPGLLLAILLGPVPLAVVGRMQHAAAE